MGDQFNPVHEEDPEGRTKTGPVDTGQFLEGLRAITPQDEVKKVKNDRLGIKGTEKIMELLNKGAEIGMPGTPEPGQEDPRQWINDEDDGDKDGKEQAA